MYLIVQYMNHRLIIEPLLINVENINTYFCLYTWRSPQITELEFCVLYQKEMHIYQVYKLFLNCIRNLFRFRIVMKEFTCFQRIYEILLNVGKDLHTVNFCLIKYRFSKQNCRDSTPRSILSSAYVTNQIYFYFGTQHFGNFSQILFNRYNCSISLWEDYGYKISQTSNNTLSYHKRFIKLNSYQH